MYPLISKITTDLGTLCMSIWIISTDDRFDQFRMAYYSGSSHTILFCNEEEELASISDLYNLAPQGVPITILTNNSESECDTDIIDSICENQERPILFKSISCLDDINTVFESIGHKIINDLLSGEYQTFTPQMVKPSNVYKLYNKKSFEKVEKLVNQLGYKLNNQGLVEISRGFYTFEIDFYRNQVKANVTCCLRCEKRCKHYRKLCVVEEDQGFSNTVHFDNLRALAVLYAIHEDEFVSLIGDKEKENITEQLLRLKEIYEINCSYYKEEQAFLKKQIKKKRKRKAS
jgi:hypothetical protein